MRLFPDDKTPLSQVAFAAMSMSANHCGRGPHGSRHLLILSFFLVAGLPVQSGEPPLPIPRFSVEHMDRSVDPGSDFYRFAAGSWIKASPVPADKSRWSGFDELQQRNWQLLRGILEDGAAGRAGKSKPAGQVGGFFASALNTNRLEKLGFKPLQRDLNRIGSLRSTDDIFRLLAEFHQSDVGVLFDVTVAPDARNSSTYAFYLSQGGLGLPDRDYYLTDAFAQQREAYRAHVAKMLALLGEKETEATAHAATVLDLETVLAKASKTRVELRDPVANYHKFAVAELSEQVAPLPWQPYFAEMRLGRLRELVVRQPGFFSAVNMLVKKRPLAEWQAYLRWHVLRSSAPYLHAAAENEWFRFYGSVLRGQPAQEPRWQRAARVIDGSIGEALGQIYVERHYPPAAKARAAISTCSTGLR